MAFIVPATSSTRRGFLVRTAGVLAGITGAAILQACGESPSPAASTSAPAAAVSTQAGAQPTTASAPTKAAAAAPVGTPKRGGALTASVQNDWVTMDPLFNSAEPSGYAMMYDGWVKWDKDPKTGQWGPQPWLVTSWDLQANAATLSLQKGVKFHDGTAWDAKTAKWNLDRMIFHPTSNVQSLFAGVDTASEDKAALDMLKANAAGPFTFASKAVEIVDDFTIKLRLKTPNAPLLSALSSTNALPVSPTAYNKAGKDAYSHNPVGTGPMRFVQWQSGSQVVVERNPDYWKMGADGKALPYLDKITYRLAVDDSVRLLDLKGGTTQFTELIQGKDIAGIKSESGLTFVQSETSGNNYRLIFDSTNPANPFVKQKGLRQAILYALDRGAMLQTLGFGAGSVRNCLLPKGSFAYPDGIPFYSYDKAKATQLVKDALTADPSLAGPNGKIPITLTVISRDVDKAQSEMIKQFADSVGFTTTIEVLERAAWTAKLVKLPGQVGGSFQIATMRNPVTADDPDIQWRAYYYSIGSFNVAHLSDPKLDMLLDQAAASYDMEVRKKVYLQLAQIAYDDPWYGFMWQQNWNWVFTKKMQNFQEPVTNFWHFTENWLDQ